MGVRELSKGGLRRLISGAAVAAAALIGTAGAASAEGLFQWSDTFVGLRYGAGFQEPANTADVEKIIGQFQHVSGWKYGTNFINVDLLYDLYKDDESDHGPDARQNKEIYAVFRETLSSSKIFGTTYGGFIRDIGLTFGGDLSYKDDQFNARVRKFVIGPSISFDVPGFWNLGILLGTEHNHNGIVGKGVEFDPTWRIETAWGIPLPLDIATPVTFKGFMNIIGPKGKDGFGNDTTTEVLLETALMFDVGAPMNLPKTVYIGFGYQWWKNKFGNDPKFTTPGTEASVPEFVAEVHF
ncbi:hypothetical protein [Zavarzinia sp.]|uniref:hypothetical protein n=1 Tax=Zavarzinia sp. TaxID=2027920 RepID=UPI003561F67B